MYGQGPPPLPYDQFPVPLRLIGRQTLGELWRGCWDAGFDAGWASGVATAAIVGMGVVLGLVLIAVILDLLRRSSRP